jgi:hypothetical protein
MGNALVETVNVEGVVYPKISNSLVNLFFSREFLCASKPR